MVVESTWPKKPCRLAPDMMRCRADARWGGGDTRRWHVLYLKSRGRGRWYIGLSAPQYLDAAADIGRFRAEFLVAIAYQRREPLRQKESVATSARLFNLKAHVDGSGLRGFQRHFSGRACRWR